jgi:carbonic anhydrase/acetyltransferase-like protein (isoleucine patch superfamily)
MTAMDAAGTEPAWIAPSAQLYGDIRLAGGVSIWPNAVGRAESQYIDVGRCSNVQDFVMLHVGAILPTRIGAYCSIAHHATVHGATVGDCCLVGIGATLMDGVVLGANSIVAGHSIVIEGSQIPPNSIVAGVPGRVIASRDNYVANKLNAFLYFRNAQAYAAGQYRLWADEIFVTEREQARASFEAEHND